MPTRPPGRHTKTFSININEEDAERLRVIAVALGKSRNGLVRELLEEFVSSPDGFLTEMQERIAERVRLLDKKGKGAE